MPFKYSSFEARVIANTVLLDEHFWNGSFCWVWIGSTRANRNGVKYPVMNVRFKSGRRKGKMRKVFVHREVLRIIKGHRMTTRSVGMHLCNYTLCVAPDHLYSKSQKANIRQCVAEGRHKTPFKKSVTAAESKGA